MLQETTLCYEIDYEWGIKGNVYGPLTKDGKIYFIHIHTH